MSTTHCQKIIFLFEAAGRRENKNVFESDGGMRGIRGIEQERGEGDRDTGKGGKQAGEEWTRREE